MELFRRILLAASLAGLLGGFVVTGLQWFGAIPLILQGETYEVAAQQPEHHGTDAVEAWAPQDGTERTLFALLANSLTGIGFALLLTAALALRGRGGWSNGLLLGAAGFLCFTLAPSLGLPPELPGTESAALVERQVWWAGTVLATAAALALLFLVRHPAAAIGAVALVLLPHFVGAPQPDRHGGLAPDDLARDFVVTALLTSLAFWLVLGSAAGFFYERFVTRPA